MVGIFTNLAVQFRETQFSSVQFSCSVVYSSLRPHELQHARPLAPHSSTLAWKIPWMEEPGGLQSMGSIRVGHDWAASLSLFTFMHWRRKWQPTPVFLPGESQGWGAWWAAVCRVTQSRTRLKRLSSSSSSIPRIPQPTWAPLPMGLKMFFYVPGRV